MVITGVMRLLSLATAMPVIRDNPQRIKVGSLCCPDATTLIIHLIHNMEAEESRSANDGTLSRNSSLIWVCDRLGTQLTAYTTNVTTNHRIVVGQHVNSKPIIDDHGKRDGEFDPTYLTICLMERLGLAWNVKRSLEAVPIQQSGDRLGVTAETLKLGQRTT